jgi:hypothetical protein
MVDGVQSVQHKSHGIAEAAPFSRYLVAVDMNAPASGIEIVVHPGFEEFEIDRPRQQAQDDNRGNDANAEHRAEKPTDQDSIRSLHRNTAAAQS